MYETTDSNKLKSIALRNTRSTLIAYAIPTFLYSGVVSFAGLSTTPYWIFVALYVFTALFIVSNMVLINLIPKFTYETGAPILYVQLIYFMVMFLIWIAMLEKARYGGLFFALSMLVYTYAYGTLKLAILVNSAIVIGYLVASYLVITVNMEDPKLIVNDILAVCAYLPVSLLLGRVGTKLAVKKRKVKALLAEQKETQKHLQDTMLKLEKAAKTDELTGLLNRREINNRLDYEFNKLKRNESIMTVLILDLDHFKQINDNYGHHCGDEVLKHIANHLTQTFRETDSVSRWGGEEFIVLMPETSLQEAQSVCHRALTDLASHPVIYNEQRIAVSASGGLCEINRDSNVEACLHQADEYLYQAKNQGRNQVLSELNNKQAAG
jgi:diguanylate cyclase (GGDEF)-like protein